MRAGWDQTLAWLAFPFLYSSGATSWGINLIRQIFPPQLTQSRLIPQRHTQGPISQVTLDLLSSLLRFTSAKRKQRKKGLVCRVDWLRSMALLVPIYNRKGKLHLRKFRKIENSGDIPQCTSPTNPGISTSRSASKAYHPTPWEMRATTVGTSD